MLIILSGQYCISELVAEFGKLPPVFLPVGNTRLYELQIEQARKAISNQEIVVTVPMSFELPEFDKKRFAKLGVRVERTKDSIALGDAIVEIIDMLNIKGNLKILFGDTFIKDINFMAQDTVCTAIPTDEYSWDNITDNTVLTGFFALSDAVAFRDAIIEANHSFILGLRSYSFYTPLKFVETKLWYDFGHVHTYYKSKTIITTQREFNSLTFGDHTFTKSSLSNPKKCEAEADWYLNLPIDLKIYTPQFIAKCTIDGKFTSYIMEYLCLPTLAELLVFSRLKHTAWSEILNAVFKFTSKAYNKKWEADFDQRAFYLGKTMNRLEAFAKGSNISLDCNYSLNGKIMPTIRTIAEDTYNAISPFDPKYMSVVHGDLCFSNIMYDFRAGIVKVIDPRGLNERCEKSIYGDIRYDFAKLAHSIVGKYDFIIAGIRDIEFDGSDFALAFFADDTSFIEELFWEKLRGVIPEIEDDIKLITIHLFLSMLPLHVDCKEKQLAILANALRLYDSYASQQLERKINRGTTQ
jgi:hypothetical protein